MARKERAHVEGDDSGLDAPVPSIEAIDDRAQALDGPAVTVMLLSDHVYLPEDPTTDDWANARVTVRYDGKVDGRRTRVAVHPSLAAFLQERGQAETLD